MWEHDPNLHECVTDGLLMYDDPKSGLLKTIVPPEMQEDLVKWQHKILLHVGSQKVFSTLKKRFHFRRMRQTCRLVNDLCPLCNLLKARMRHAHKHFRAKQFCTPRTSYGADYYPVRQNKEGYNKQYPRNH